MFSDLTCEDIRVSTGGRCQEPQHIVELLGGGRVVGEGGGPDDLLQGVAQRLPVLEHVAHQQAGQAAEPGETGRLKREIYAAF